MQHWRLRKKWSAWFAKYTIGWEVRLFKQSSALNQPVAIIVDPPATDTLCLQRLIDEGNKFSCLRWYGPNKQILAPVSGKTSIFINRFDLSGMTLMGRKFRDEALEVISPMNISDDSTDFTYLVDWFFALACLHTFSKWPVLPQKWHFSFHSAF